MSAVSRFREVRAVFMAERRVGVVWYVGLAEEGKVGVE